MTIDDGVLDANEDVGDLVNDLESELQLGLEWAGFWNSLRLWIVELDLFSINTNNFNTTKYCINLFSHVLIHNDHHLIVLANFKSISLLDLNLVT